MLKIETVFLSSLPNGKKFVSEPNELQGYRIAKVLDARFKIQRMLRVFAKVFNIPTKTSLSFVWSDFLFEMLQPGRTRENNQLFWYVTFTLLLRSLQQTKRTIHCCFIAGDLKVCTYCSKIVLDYLKSSEINSDLKLDLQALQEDLSSKFSHQSSIDPQDSSTSQRHRKISIGYQEERLVSHLTSTLSNADRKNILQQSNSLKSLFEEMTKALSYQNRGSDLVSFLISNQKSSNKIQAVAILNAMIEAGFLVGLSQVVSNESVTSFDENIFYKLLRIDDSMSHSGSFQLDLDLEASSVHLSRPNLDSLGWLEGITKP